MSSFDSRRGRYFHTRNRVYDRSPGEARGRFRGRSRERSVSRDKFSARSEKGRGLEKFERKPSRERLQRSRSRERSRSRDRFRSGYSRERDTFDGRGMRSQDRFDYQYENATDGRPAGDRSDFNRELHREPSPQDLHDIDDLPDYQQEDQNYWKTSEQEPESVAPRSRPNDEPAYLRHSPTAATSIPEQVNSGMPPAWHDARSQLPNFGQEKATSFISEFDPTNPQVTSHMWIKEIDKIGDEKGWSLDEKKYHFTSKLTGSAKDWFISGNRILDSWSKLKKQFVQSFPSEMDYHSLLVLMMGRMKLPTESLSNYFNYKTVLMNTCGITGRKAVSCLIGGLNGALATLKLEAMDMNFETSEELYNFLKDKAVDAPAPDPSKTRVTKKICYVCRKQGHESSNCPQNKAKKKKQAKFFKQINVNGVAMRAYFDNSYPHIMFRIKDAHAANIKFHRKFTTINGSDTEKINALAQQLVTVKVDSLVFTPRIFIVPNNAITSVILGKAIMKYANLIENDNSICFTTTKVSGKKSLEASTQEHSSKPQASYDHQSYKERSQMVWSSSMPSRYKQQDHPISTRLPTRRPSPVRSPLRSPPEPPRIFEKSHPFLSKSFYGNPYL